MKSLFFVALVLGAMTGSAFAQGYYAEGTLGYTFSEDIEFASVDIPTDNGYLFGLAVGRQLTNGFSFEGEYTYSTRSVESLPIDINTQTLMANAYYNFILGQQLSAYVGAGLGMGWVEVDFAGITDSDTALSYQGIAGLAYNAGNNVSLFGEYRYQGISTTTIGGADVDYAGHSVGGGLRFAF